MNRKLKRLTGVLLTAVMLMGTVTAYAAPVKEIQVVSGDTVVEATAGAEYALRDGIIPLTADVNRMASEHFQIIWGNENTANTTVTEDFVYGNLLNLENIRSFYIEELGMEDISTSVTGALAGKYKTNIYISNTGLTAFEDDWAYMSTDSEGFAYLFLSPDAMRVDMPSWVVPHELAHAFTYHQGGTIDYAWYEATANWFRDQYLGSEYYAYGDNTYGPDSDFFAPYMMYGEYYVPHMLNWYDTWPLFLYISENPDNIQGLGLELMHKIFQNTQTDNSMYATIERLSGVSIKTVLAGMTRRLATMDFSRQTHYLEELNNTLAADATNYSKIYTTLKEADSEGYQAVPDTEAPMQTGFNIIPLNVDLTKDVLRADFISTSTEEGADFRVSLVTATGDNTTRYSDILSGDGTCTIDLMGDEVKAYLVVCATPDTLKGYQVDWDSAATDEDTRYSYKVKISTEDAVNAFPGDVNLDYVVDKADAFALLSHISGIQPIEHPQSLINGECDGRAGLSIGDVVWILKAIAPAEEDTNLQPSPLATGTYLAKDILNSKDFTVYGSTSATEVKIDEQGYVEFGINDGATLTITFKCGSSDSSKSASINLYDRTSQTLYGDGTKADFVVTGLEGGFYRLSATQSGGTTAQIISIKVA